MDDRLESLLRRIRDGHGTAETQSEARALVADDDRIPAELRDLVLLDEAEAASDAAGLLSVLGADDLGEVLAAAVRAEGAEPSVLTEAQLEPDAEWMVIAEVLRDGLRRIGRDVELATHTLARLTELQGWAWGPVVSAAVRAEAGPVDSSLVGRVMEALSLTVRVPPVAEAVRAEAGTVDVAAAVLKELGLGAAAKMPSPVVEAPRPLAAPANNQQWHWAAAGLVLAAAFLAMVLRGASPGGGSPEPMTFAHASDIVVEDLSYGEGVEVFETLSDDGTVILWLDEEA